MIYKATNKNQNAAYGSPDALIARPFAWRYMYKKDMGELR